MAPAPRFYKWPLRAYLAISLGGILFWAFQVIPEPITGLLIPILFCIVGVVTPDIAFTPWSMIVKNQIAAGTPKEIAHLSPSAAENVSFFPVDTAILVPPPSCFIALYHGSALEGSQFYATADYEGLRRDEGSF